VGVGKFREQLGAKKVAGKTMERLKKLIWLAAQDVKAELAGRETYEYQALASLVGVNQRTGQRRLRTAGLRCGVSSLHSDSGLYCRLRSRSQQKATNFDRSLCKTGLKRIYFM
jgi:hypothetical protein